MSATTNVGLNKAANADDDDWDTDPDFVNDVSEKDQRWTSKSQKEDPRTNEDFKTLIQQVVEQHEGKVEKKSDFSRGYGGKYGVENRTDGKELIIKKSGDASREKEERKA